jgi:hypothetical protein
VKKIALAALVLGELACASAGHRPIFHRASASYSVMLDISGVDRVVVRSSVSQEALKVLRESARARIFGTMDYLVQGYHGRRKDAGVEPVAPAEMSFDQERVGSTLTLKSREWVYIHHSMLYTTLSIAVPEGVDVFAQPYSYDELTQRATVQ